ncbi:MAG: hypothetical protein NC078_04395 [Ruminococcus sp.]|nr:hypothetical protein [Ruminococcus sp.]
MYCKNCGKEIHDEAVMCVHCGVPTGKTFHSANEPATTGLIVLSVLFPLIGFILGGVLKSQGRERAGNAYIKAAGISFGVCAILGIIGSVIL